MTTGRQNRFENAYQAWQSSPIEIVEISAGLADVSQSLKHVQDDITPTILSLRKTGQPLPSPIPQLWEDGMSTLILRGIRSARWMSKQGRNQVATRELLRRAEVLKEVWNAYRGVIEN